MDTQVRQGGVYLEPGELAELARAASSAAVTAGLHPRALLLQELARTLEGMAERPLGCVLLPAETDDAAEAARRYLLTDGHQQVDDAAAPGLAIAGRSPAPRPVAACPA